MLDKVSVNAETGIDDGYSNQYTPLITTLSEYLRPGGFLDMSDLEQVLPHRIEKYEEYIKRRGADFHTRTGEVDSSRQIFEESNKKKVRKLDILVGLVNHARDQLYANETMTLDEYRGKLQAILDWLNELDQEVDHPIRDSQENKDKEHGAS